MPNAIEDYVTAYERAQNFVTEVYRGHGALGDLQRVRDNVVVLLAEIQSSPAYAPEVKTAANTMAADLRQAILDFADTL